MCNTEDCLHYDYVRLAWDIGFTFEEYEMKNGFDISVIGLVDVEKVAKDRDIPTVIKHIPTLLNFRLDNEMSKVLEPNFIKLFRLSQLAIQYLIFCKKYLDSTVALIKNELIAVNDEKSDLEVYLEDLKLENDEVKRKYDELKATMSTSIFKCEECSKTFYSEEYLLAHIRRRHQVHNVQMQTEADKLQLEIKELKQRLNNTERLILNDDFRLAGKDEVNNGDKMSPKESEGDKEKELESVEPNNDAIFENTIQYKFEQLKSHIETEINSLKDEDFYKGICERYIKERVAKNLSVTTIQSASEVEVEQEVQAVHDVGIQNGRPSQQLQPLQPKTNEVSVEVDEHINIKVVESSTQTDYKNAVSEGTSMSPQPTARRLSKPHDDGDHESIGIEKSSESVTTTPVKVPASTSRRTSIEISSLAEGKENSNQVVMKTIEEKLAKEAEYQRETLEHILDLKLSGSLNKMEAQMTAFWQKLNAWESNLSAKSSSVPSINVHSEPVKNVRETGDLVLKRQNSVGSLASGSPVNKMAARDVNVHGKPNQKSPINVPKALPRRSFITQKSPVIVVPKARESIKDRANDVSRFLDSSDDEEDQKISEVSKTTESKTSESTSEEETPSNMKPTESFKKRLDETLMQRLKPQTKVQTVAEINHPPLRNRLPEKANVPRNVSKNTIQDSRPSKLDNIEPTERKSDDQSVSEDNNSNGSDNNYKNMKKRLRRHVEESVDQKLKDIGVSPHWKCLPEKSYNKAMEIVEHQANLSKKNISDFHKIRRNIERAIDKEIVNDNDVKKRRATVNLPVNAKTIPHTIATPAESYAPSESSVEIPLQRVSGRPTIKPNSRRTSFQAETINLSPIKTSAAGPGTNHHQTPQFHVVKGKKLELGNMVTVTSIPAKDINKEVEVMSSSANTFAIAENTPQNHNQKKKVLFNLDSDTEQSEHQSPVKLPQTKVQVQNKKDLTTFVEQEKTKLNLVKQGKHKKQGQLELHTGSESSDWDISDIT